MDCPVTARPTVIVISDSLGDTACEVVLAASGQFDEGAFRLLRLPKVTSVEQVESFVGPRVDADPSGEAWARLLHDHRIAHVMLRPDSLTPAQRAGLQRSGATLEATAGEAQWWRIPDRIADNGQP